MIDNKIAIWTPRFFAACAANFALFFAFYMLMPIMPMYLADEFRADNSTIGLVLSSYVIMALLIRPFAGFFVDTWPRKILMMVCYAAYVVIFGGYVVASTLIGFTIFRALHGLTFGITTVSVNTVAIDIIPAQRRGEGIGYFGIMSNLAMAFGPMSSMLLLGYFGGYKPMFVLATAVALVGLFFAALVKTPAREPVKGKAPMSLDRFILTKGLWAALTMMLLSFGYGTLNTYIAIYGQQKFGIDSGVGMFFLCLAGGLIVSRILSGRFINNGYFRMVGITGIVLLIVSYTMLVLSHDPMFYYISGVISGVGYGMISPTFQTMLINMGASHQRGTANATYFASWDLGIGLGIMLGGVVSDKWNFDVTFLSEIGLLVLGLFLFVLVVMPYYEKNKVR